MASDLQLLSNVTPSTTNDNVTIESDLMAFILSQQGLFLPYHLWLLFTDRKLVIPFGIRPSIE
ncbi:unnamed protein product [Prunus armeniaca]